MDRGEQAALIQKDEQQLPRHDERSTGQNAGASHHFAVNGTVCAFHQMIQVFRAGSPRSCGSASVTCMTSGHVCTIVKAT